MRTLGLYHRSPDNWFGNLLFYIILLVIPIAILREVVSGNEDFIFLVVIFIGFQVYLKIREYLEK